MKNEERHETHNRQTIWARYANQTILAVLPLALFIPLSRFSFDTFRFIPCQLSSLHFPTLLLLLDSHKFRRTQDQNYTAPPHTPQPHTTRHTTTPHTRKDSSEQNQFRHQHRLVWSVMLCLRSCPRTCAACVRRKQTCACAVRAWVCERADCKP